MIYLNNKDYDNNTMKFQLINMNKIFFQKTDSVDLKMYITSSITSLLYVVHVLIKITTNR